MFKKFWHRRAAKKSLLTSLEDKQLGLSFKIKHVRVLLDSSLEIEQHFFGELAKAFGATKTPHVYLFNHNEKLVFKGAIDDNARNPNKVNHSYLMDAIEQMLNGEGIKKPISKAMGCSIKFN